MLLVEVKSSSGRLSGEQKRCIADNHEHLRLPFRLVKLHRKALAVTAGGFAIAAAPASQPWQDLGPDALAWIAGAAIFKAVGNCAVVATSPNVVLSTVAPFRYSSIIWALLFGHAFWAKYQTAASASVWR